MTRVRGTRIIKAPCCGAEMSTPNYLSMNFLAWEYWTDGYDDGSLMPDKDGLRRCTCGASFLMWRAEHLRTIRDGDRPRAPAGWQTRRDNWWTRLLGRETRAQIMERYDVRTDAEIEATHSLLPPWPDHVKASELAGLIAAGTADAELEAVLRRRYWQHLNEPFRAVYRQFRDAHHERDAEGDSATFPEFTTSPEQTDNMRRLLPLLEAMASPDWLEIAELNRELGDFAQAKASLDHPVSNERLHLVISKLTQQKVRCPVRFNY